MVTSVSSLANMEQLLYGGSLGLNPNCPSMINGYQASNGYYDNFNPYLMQNGLYNNPYQIYNNTINNQTQNNKQQQKSVEINKSDIEKLANYYEDSNTYVQKWGDLGMSAASIALFENSQTMKHFINSGKAIKKTNEIFNMSNSAVKELWKKNPELAQKAYAQLHAVNRAAGSKTKYIGGWFQKTMDENSRKYLSNIMETAINTGDEKEILKATETLKAARGMDGKIPSAWNKINNFFGGKAKNYTPKERISRKASEIDKVVNAPMAVRPGVTGLLKQGLKEGKTFALFALIADLPKLISAYENGGAGSAATQATQTGIRAVTDGIGWTVGRAAGSALGTKVGAIIGTHICPGIGTAVGAALGFIGGAAGSILASKISHILIPKDEATKLEADKLKETKEGQAQLLSLVAQNAQMGEKIPDDVMVSAENVAKSFGIA